MRQRSIRHLRSYHARAESQTRTKGESAPAGAGANTMNPQTLAQWLTALSLAERAKALNLVSFRLTIHARECGLPSTDQSSAARKLLGINELHHKLLSQTCHYLDG